MATAKDKKKAGLRSKRWGPPTPKPISNNPAAALALLARARGRR
jgi:hypothetical protein